MKNFFILLALTFATLASSAQIEVSRPPKSSRMSVMSVPKTIRIDPPPSSKNAEINPKGRAYFGNLLPCDIDFMQDATATDIDGGTLYTLMLTSKGAYSIGIRTEGLVISHGSELYLYNNDRDDILGALTSQNSSQIMRQIAGDTLNIELFVPQGVEQKDFKITKICYDYANAFGKTSKSTQYKASCSTEVNINCDEGQAFQDIKHATVLLSIDSDGQTMLCTGTIVNNVQCDQTPYVLTAAHCLCSDEAASNTIVYFNYELPTCTSRNMPYNYNTMTGATIVATAPKKAYTDKQGRTSSKEYPTLDFTLLKLNKAIPDSYEPYYAGLSISETENLDNVAAVHHPQGDVKKVSIAYSPVYQDSYPEEDKEVHYNTFCHWHVAKWDVGTTEGGSSGASLLNAKKQVVGVLSGGYADCNEPVNDFFQMVSKAWNLYPEPENQLQQHLALGSHVTEIMPYNPLNLGEYYLPAVVSATLAPDSTLAYLSWQQMREPETLPTFAEDFDNMLTDKEINDVFIANIDMDNDRSAWQLTSTSDAHSGSNCVVSKTSNYGVTNDYLTISKLTINAGDTLRFWAKSEGGVSTLLVSQNNKPTRYREVARFEISGDWQEYKVSLDEYAGSSIYINFSHVTETGNSTAVCLDDISIDGGPKNNADSPKISGYEVYCNDDLVQSISDTASRSYDYHLQNGNTYTFYVLNVYEGGATSGIGNSIVIDLNHTTTTTPTAELNPSSETLVAYPNPTSGVVYIVAPHDIRQAEIFVYDLAGRKVMSQRVGGVSKGENIELSLAALRTGVYIIRLGNQTLKIQKQ